MRTPLSRKLTKHNSKIQEINLQVKSYKKENKVIA
jgi:hypothetical protein